MKVKRISLLPVGKCVLALFFDKVTGKVCLPCIGRIFYNFFYKQWKAHIFKNVPVKNVDHPLDAKIPFMPEKVKVYLTFIGFWIRTAGALLMQGLKNEAADFVQSIGKLYEFAGALYSRHMSTTTRPRYLKRLRFVLIHAFDPHLMCVPSLHVMIVAFVYRSFARCLPGQVKEIEELRAGALAITESVLYVKQHSVNCIAAAFYALTRFDGELFPPAEADDFTARLFVDGTLPEAQAGLVREYIMKLYWDFLARGEGRPWEAVLLDFLDI
jgi:hypothetical protein